MIARGAKSQLVSGEQQKEIDVWRSKNTHGRSEEERTAVDRRS
jgi:hypothetical protein